MACAQTTSTMNKKSEPVYEIQKPEEEWKQQLSTEQYYVLRQKGTEAPYSGKFLMHKENGHYTCAACGNILFESDAKFDSHCGWPSFDKQISEKAVVTKEDRTHGMIRTEILCGKCGGHLGHVFDDGPTETGQRYCVNSLSLSFEPAGTTASTTDTLTLGGGCFWCIEAFFQDLRGVIKVESGYSGGASRTTTYKEVCTGRTGHAEVVQITFDPGRISATELLKVFFTMHDPTTLNRQGNDIGTQYRSVIFYRNDRQKKLAEETVEALNREKVFPSPVVTEIAPFSHFIKAENYHQDYYNNNPNEAYCQMVIRPKLEKLEKVFGKMMEK